MPDSGGYRVITNGERSNGGDLPQPRRAPAGLAPLLRRSRTSTGCSAELDGLGGRLFNGPVEVPAGRFAVLADPQGAMFAVLTGDYDD